MSGNTLSRRRVLQGAGGVGVSSVVSIQPVNAEQKKPPERYIVGVKPGQAGLARREADDVYRELDFGDVGQVVSGRFPQQALSALRNNPNVRYIEPEVEVKALGDQSVPWGIDRTNADVAINDDDIEASGSKIAIIDTGIDPDHESLRVAGGQNFTGESTDDWTDRNGHGTSAAGIATALDNDVGVVGVAPEAELYAVKVLDDDGTGTNTDVAAAIEWAVNQGIDVGNLSLGSSVDSDAIKDAVRYAAKEGTVIVAAAGNNGPDEDTVLYPAAYEECIAVSATTEDDSIADLSSRGEEVDIAAPGERIYSTHLDNQYTTQSGTSMAAPHVAGAAAYLMATGKDHTEVETELTDTAVDLELKETEQGSGLLNVEALVTNGEEDDAGGKDLAIETTSSNDVTDSSATLTGKVTKLKGYDEVTVYFEWRESDSDRWTTTERQTLESSSEFDSEVTTLGSSTEYEFRAVAEAGDTTQVGETDTFTTGSGDEPTDTDSVIEEFTVQPRNTGPWTRADVEWEVSNEDGDLYEATTELMDGDGAVLDAETTDIRDTTSSDRHSLRTRNKPEAVRLTVIDENNNEADLKCTDL
ncbi:S8 family peptidase [Natronolimnohabitans sp. A-GB9]|uniref:S8 family peptidase n=1 Tax=Natronolimnohabitans sp. A-GB9 TaxID=3069757 RepID=UPI0027B6AABB|nr:S8 family peptidase [Natronolimnohabitans sp. A-GB9]MDQ2049205.1 S8 family peptidase [Natronolimnohabitans sp. A-GB9]